MPVIKRRHTSDFTVLPNDLLQDQRLSCRDRGLLVWMLSMPPDWNFSHNALLKELRFDKKGAVQSCIKKLKELGYLKIIQERNNGRLGNKIWYVCDTPYPDIPNFGISSAYKINNIKKKKAVPTCWGGEQPSYEIYYDPELGEYRRRERT